MKIDWQKARIKKLAAIISAHLQKNGIVSIGDEPISKFNNLKTRFGTICLLT
jgi:hypothetical protein